jgi:hypothetical protein
VSSKASINIKHTRNWQVLFLALVCLAKALDIKTLLTVEMEAE